jgi:thermostable 8-oxoguanine DNA glycosylase
MIFSGSLQELVKPPMVRFAYLNFIEQNEATLAKVNQLLISKKANATWINDSTFWEPHGISMQEGSHIRNLISKEDVLIIQKDSVKIRYQTYYMDSSQGLYYFYTVFRPLGIKKHLTGDWYY